MIISGKKLVVKALLLFLAINLVDFMLEIFIFKITIEQWLIKLGGATLYVRAIIALTVGLYYQRKEESKKEEQEERSY
ncbi:hypothetical protein [Aquiflexum lacus]|uniref:hypothetical protein n=1 Tax=Aquiflexum lacus TaxID=2483805 RepID=UPI001895B3D6|nr:hypothetical protein [Aquiflexum lacus]